MPLTVVSTKASAAPATNIVATYALPAGYAAPAGAPATLPTANNEQFGYALFYDASILGRPGAQFSQLFGFNVPSNVKDFVALLPDHERNNLADAFAHPSGSGSCKGDDRALVDVLEQSQSLERVLKFLNKAATGSTATTYAPPAISTLINKPGLHLLLANPVVNAVVMAQRKAQTAAAMARPVVPVPSSPFGLPVPGGLTIRLSGGALEELDPAYPIDMRGAGPSLAAMKGGYAPLLIGTAGSPTSWRPISDNSFISTSLKAALESLKSTLADKKASLATATDTQIGKLVTDLENAEKAVIKHRDALTDMNNAIASGSANVNNKTGITMAQVQTTADAYNQAMKMRQKLENKLFRVVVALGGKVVYP
jgi:hypothetical protein